MITGNLLKSLTCRLSNWMEIIAGIALVGIMLLSGWDIVGRTFGYPILGAYEIISFAGGLVIGLAVPVTTKVKGHVCVDLLLERLSKKTRLFLAVMTRSIGIVTFLLMGYGTIMMGIRLRAAGEVTAALGLPFYHVAYALGGAFFVEALLLLSEIIEQRGSWNE